MLAKSARLGRPSVFLGVQPPDPARRGFAPRTPSASFRTPLRSPTWVPRSVSFAGLPLRQLFLWLIPSRSSPGPAAPQSLFPISRASPASQPPQVRASPPLLAAFSVAPSPVRLPPWLPGRLPRLRHAPFPLRLLCLSRPLRSSPRLHLPFPTLTAFCPSAASSALSIVRPSTLPPSRRSASLPSSPLRLSRPLPLSPPPLVSPTVRLSHPCPFRPSCPGLTLVSISGPALCLLAG
jgi:hypothetical protein